MTSPAASPNILFFYTVPGVDMPSHARYFILDAQHEPVEVSLDEWCRWRGANDPLEKTVIDAHAQVTTKWGGLIDDVTMPGPPTFFHIVEGPGVQQNIVHTNGYEAAMARHDRIAQWLYKRAERFNSSR
ncbi:hypothetical protein [Paraburkholderia sp. SIMBA_027]|uniref:hypothetical protein n=1 Tax=Paraburkholderia sp. SIMBA_027 TaxID=3085770 RepID=UPI00397B4A14